MLRISGSPMDVALQAGVYIMSSFEPITKSTLVKNTDTTRQKLAKRWTGAAEPSSTEIANRIVLFYQPFMAKFKSAVLEFSGKAVAQIPSLSPSFNNWYNSNFMQGSVKAALTDADDVHGEAVYPIAIACFTRLIDRGQIAPTTGLSFP